MIYPDPRYPHPQNPHPQNPSPQYPSPQYPSPQYPSPQNPSPQNPSPQNPSPQNPDARERETPVIAVLIIAAVCATNVWILKGGGGPLPWVGATAGFLMALGLPTWMLSRKVDWKTGELSERFCYSVVTAILGLMVVGLIINTALPHIGISRPLTAVLYFWPLMFGVAGSRCGVVNDFPQQSLDSALTVSAVLT